MECSHRGQSSSPPARSWPRMKPIEHLGQRRLISIEGTGASRVAGERLKVRRNLRTSRPLSWRTSEGAPGPSLGCGDRTPGDGFFCRLIAGGGIRRVAVRSRRRLRRRPRATGPAGRADRPGVARPPRDGWWRAGEVDGQRVRRAERGSEPRPRGPRGRRHHHGRPRGRREGSEIFHRDQVSSTPILQMNIIIMLESPPLVRRCRLGEEQPSVGRALRKRTTPAGSPHTGALSAVCPSCGPGEMVTRFQSGRSRAPALTARVRPAGSASRIRPRGRGPAHRRSAPPSGGRTSAWPVDRGIPERAHPKCSTPRYPPRMGSAVRHVPDAPVVDYHVALPENCAPSPNRTTTGRERRGRLSRKHTGAAARCGRG